MTDGKTNAIPSGVIHDFQLSGLRFLDRDVCAEFEYEGERVTVKMLGVRAFRTSPLWEGNLAQEIEVLQFAPDTFERASSIFLSIDPVRDWMKDLQIFLRSSSELRFVYVAPTCGGEIACICEDVLVEESEGS